MTETANRESRALSCPCAPAEGRQARIFGLVGGTDEAPRLTYLAHPLRVTSGLLAQLEGVSPAEVFRVVSPCLEDGCEHFVDGACSLSKQVTTLPAVTNELPACGIRATCRWFAERRAAACTRCPQVVTMVLQSQSSASPRRHLPLV